MFYLLSFTNCRWQSMVLMRHYEFQALNSNFMWKMETGTLLWFPFHLLVRLTNMFSNTCKKLDFHLCVVLKIWIYFLNLYFRYLDHNQFSGRIPEPFYKHPFLKEMWVSNKVVQITNNVLWTEQLIICSWQVHWGKCIPAWCQPHWFPQSAWSFWWRLPRLMRL